MRCGEVVRVIVACGVLGLVQPGRGAAQQADAQAWGLVTATVPVGEAGRWFAYLEAQGRLGDDASRFERILLRPALGRQLSPQVGVFVGYAWTPTFMDAAYASVFRGEHRAWQQAVITHRTAGLSWQHRIRQEQRWLEGAAGASHRTRYLLRGSRGLGSGGIGITGYHELFVTWNDVDRGPQAGFDRNRWFAGPYLVRGPVRYEAGYLGEYGRRFGDGSRVLHAALVSASVTF